MYLTYLMFAVAIALSAVAAFYSIVGLTAIFAAAVIPIIIMGTILEIAKVVVTLWLHEYWRQCRLLMKMYLVPAVFVLMVITSMGIFGFLSKAHLDQTVPTGDVAAQVQLIDERINNERDTIANARSLLAQLDRAVVDISNAPDREVNGRVISSAERALQVRRQQAQDRARLTQTIEQSQARIVKLQEEKAPFARDLRKIEAEVGPIKYIAALIYGDNPDSNLLEKAVRWVIIILVAVFDPLAIMMLLAATESLAWARRQREEKKNEPVAIHSAGQTQPISATDADPGSLEQHAAAPEPVAHSSAQSSGTVATVTEPTVLDPTPEPLLELVQDSPIQTSSDSGVPDDIDDIDDTVTEIKQAKARWKEANPTSTLKEQRELFFAGRIPYLPWMDLVDFRTGFGPQWPTDARRGDLWIRTDGLPHRLYKYNGDKWIEIDKNRTDVYSYNDAYLEHLIAKISSGEYDPELLTETEREQIQQRLMIRSDPHSDHGQ